jgi:hypothetical protein
MSDLKIPTIHLNGTSKEQLFEQICNAIDGVHAAGDALAKATPNARDYYPQGPEAIYEAMRQHETRMTKLREVARELETIAQAIM